MSGVTVCVQEGEVDTAQVAIGQDPARKTLRSFLAVPRATTLSCAHAEQ
jgi:hypothetical protein